MGAQEQIVATEQLIASQGAQVTDKPAEPAQVVEVVATPDDDADPTGDDAESSTDAIPEPNHSNKKPAKERISELTKNWRQEQRDRQRANEETDYWRQQALGNKSNQQPEASQPTPSQDSQKKTLESFGYDQDQYLDYLAEKKADSVLLKRDAAEAEKQKQTAGNQRMQSYQERVAKYEAEHPDMDYQTEVTNGNLPISPTMAEFIVESDIGPQLGVYFRDNPDEAKAMYALSPRDADRALVKLSGTFATPAATESSIPSPPAQITRAPPVPGQVSASTPRKAGSTMDEEIAAVRALRKRRT
jgi:hypothetical protein